MTSIATNQLLLFVDVISSRQQIGFLFFCNFFIPFLKTELSATCNDLSCPSQESPLTDYKWRSLANFELRPETLFK
jgi:hypothetical protein